MSQPLVLPQSLVGPVPSVFIGHKNYPHVFAGPLVSMVSQHDHDDPKNWFGRSPESIILLRSSLLRTRVSTDIFSRSSFCQTLRELSLAAKPPETEFAFKKSPQPGVRFSSLLQPMGPTATIERYRVTENIKIAPFVDKVISDDLSATAGAFALYQHGIDSYRLTTMLSSGVLGQEAKKRLVPTRWSITAVDDTLFKKLASRVKEYPCIDQYMLFTASYIGNTFSILLMPGEWEFENFEQWNPGSYWSEGQPSLSREYESYEGRTAYAHEQGGGYYAARLAVIEALERLQVQARVLSIREISNEYTIPLGVWVVRETARHAFEKQPQTCASLDEALAQMQTHLQTPLARYRIRSRLLSQRRLSEFF